MKPSMKTLSLRQAIVQRIQNKSNEQLIEVINGSIGSDEMALPGLGVIFEMIWPHIEEQQRLDLVSVLNDHLATENSI